MSEELKLKGTSFDEIFAECEKDPEFRREYLRATMEEIKELILENNALRKKLEIAVEAMKETRICILENYPITGYRLLKGINYALAEIEKVK